MTVHTVQELEPFLTGTFVNIYSIYITSTLKYKFDLLLIPSSNGLPTSVKVMSSFILNRESVQTAEVGAIFDR